MATQKPRQLANLSSGGSLIDSSNVSLGVTAPRGGKKGLRLTLAGAGW